MTTPRTFTLTFRILNDAIPPIARLKRMLKFRQRSYSMRVIDLRESHLDARSNQGGQSIAIPAKSAADANLRP